MLQCPVCTSKSPWPLGTLREMPMVSCQFAASRSEAVNAPRGTLELSLCAGCGHIYNCAFEPRRMQYGLGYDNALGFSAKYREYRDALVRRLVDVHDLHNKSILDIGCGHADFLSEICGRGGNNGIGYDPTQPARSTQVGNGYVTVVPQVFAAQNVKPVDFVCSQHVLEHLYDLRKTLHEVRSALKDEGAAYFEVPNGAATFRHHLIWDLTYEHVSYFSAMSLERALLDAGFAISRLGTSFGDQYLQAEVQPDLAPASEKSGVAHDSPSAATRLAWREAADIRRDFPIGLRTLLADWKDRLAHAIGKGHRIVLWGAGTKAVSFLNMLAIGPDQIEYVVDINPRKVGRFIAGTGQRIISPQRLGEYRPSSVFVMNPQYAGEIRSVLDSIGVHCDLVPVLDGPAA